MKFNFNATFNYQYNQSYTSGGRNLYRLDSLHGAWRLPADEGGRLIGALPSTRDSLLASADWSKSRASERRVKVKPAELSLSRAQPT